MRGNTSNSKPSVIDELSRSHGAPPRAAPGVKADYVVNDYAGHPFQIELSDELAAQGNRVVHAYCSTNVTPRGDFERDNPRLSVEAISTGNGFDKYNARRRLIAEIRYGLSSVKVVVASQPDSCLNANMPIVSLAMITLACKVLRIRSVLWLQDFQAGLAAMALGSESHPIVRILTSLERWCVRNADHVIPISDGFNDEVQRIGVSAERQTTISNWAPLDDVEVLDKDNAWAQAHDLDASKLRLVYSGSMGIKHRPESLVSLSKALAEVDQHAEILVVSEGVGADWLKEQTVAEGLANISFLPFQPFESLPEVLASADVLLVLLEPDAGEFSVPSKVLTYLCASRPIAGLMLGKRSESSCCQRGRSRCRRGARGRVRVADAGHAHK